MKKSCEFVKGVRGDAHLGVLKQRKASKAPMMRIKSHNSQVVNVFRRVRGHAILGKNNLKLFDLKRLLAQYEAT